MTKPEPPYVAVIFTSLVRSGHEAEYDRTAALMEELAARIPGFLGVESSRSPDGHGITVSYWRDDEAVAAWRDHPEHLEAKSRGRNDWYEWYEIRVAQVEQARSFRS